MGKFEREMRNCQKFLTRTNKNMRINSNPNLHNQIDLICKVCFERQNIFVTILFGYIVFVQFCAKTFEAFKRICSMLMCRRLLPYFWDWVVSPHLPVKENIFLESGFHHWSAITMVGRWWSGKGKKEGSDNLRREKIWRRLFTAGKYYNFLETKIWPCQRKALNETRYM